MVKINALDLDTKEKVLSELIANKHTIQQITDRLIFTKVNDRNENDNVFGGTTFKCFILNNATELEEVVTEYITKHCLYFKEMEDLVEYAISKIPITNTFNIQRSNNLPPHNFILNGHIFLDKFHTTTICNRNIYEMCYLDITNCGDVNLLNGKWITEVAKHLQYKICEGRNLFLKLVNNAILVEGSKITVNENLVFEMDIEDTHRDADIYARIIHRGDVIHSATDNDFYMQLHTLSHLIDVK